jgi:hypothetical protein
LPDIRLEVGLLLALANGVVVWIAARGGSGRIPLAAVVVGSLLASVGFNPVVRGGSEHLVKNRLSREILEIDQRHGGESTWIVFGNTHLSNLFRVLGVRAINGLHPVPQFDLWAQLDPDGRHRHIYNRYALIVFGPVVSHPPTVSLLGHRVLATFDPENRALRELGVTHVLLHGGNRHELSRFPSYRLLASVGENHLFAFHGEDP